MSTETTRESPAQQDAPTGGTITIKRGATREVVYHASRGKPEAPAAPGRTSARQRRRCRFCGRPILFLGAPLVLVLVFTLRLQRLPGGSAYANLSGYAALLDLGRSGDEVRATVAVRPGGRVATFMLRQSPTAPGSPVEVVFRADSDLQKPVLLYGETPGPGSPTTMLQVPLRALPGRPLSVRAELSIGGRTVTLVRTIAAGDANP